MKVSKSFRSHQSTWSNKFAQSQVHCACSVLTCPCMPVWCGSERRAKRLRWIRRGPSAPPWADLLRNALAKEEARISPAAISSINLILEENAPAFPLSVKSIAYRDHALGWLVLGTAAGTEYEIRETHQILLSILGNQLALRLYLEEREEERQGLLTEQAAQASLAMIGELSGPITHEFNNFLNTVLLHVAVLEQGLPESRRADLAELREQAKSAAELIKQFQQIRRRRQTKSSPVDLNRMIRDAISALSLDGPNQTGVPMLQVISAANPQPPQPASSQPAVSVFLELTASPLFVLGSTADLKNLCTMLLTNAIAAGSDQVSIRTELGPESIRLYLEDAGPLIKEELLPRMFEATVAARIGTNRLELALCKSIVRRFQGKIRAENKKGQGVLITVELPKG